MKKNYFHFVAVSLLLIMLGSCLKKQEFPDEPQLEYIEFIQFDSVGLTDPIGYVTMKFTDGDGNVGLNDADSTDGFGPGEPFENNLFITIFTLVDGEFVPADVETDANVRIGPRLSDEEDTPIEGDIDAGVFIPPFGSDTVQTIRWEIYLVDRDLNESNLIVTPEFVFQR